MDVSNSLYLIPPMITTLTALYIAVMGIYRVYLKPENALLSLLCLLWALLSISFLSQRLMTTEQGVLMLEKLTHLCFAWFPLAHILFFHRILKVKSRPLVLFAAVLSFAFSIAVFSPWYITGLKQYSWGYFAQAGPLFYLFLVYALMAVGYVIHQVFLRLKIETNLIMRMKLRYTRFSFISAALFTIASALAMMGYDLYPPGHFVFLPLGFLGYGILRYRFLGSRSMLHLTVFWLMVSVLAIVPNALLFVVIREPLAQLTPVWQFIVLTFWFIAGFHLVLKSQSLINRVVSTSGYNLKKVESVIFRDILFLKNIDELSREFRDLVSKYLAFSDVVFFLSGEEDGVYEDTRGHTLVMPPFLDHWILTYDHMIDSQMVGTHPRFEAVKADLLRLLDEQKAQFMVPLVQHGSLLGMAFLKDEYPNRLMVREEIQFVDRLSDIVSIALYNSMVFEAISGLKDQLEDKTLKLSAEIAEREKGEEEIKKSRAQYKLLADNVKDTIWVLRVEDLTFSYMSPSVKHLLGYTIDEVQGMRLDQILAPESMAFILKVREGFLKNGRLDRGETLTLELEHMRKDATRVWVEVSAHALGKGDEPLRLIGVSRDITERKKAEAEKKALESRLMQAQKMESIGVLAGGIAHDFNNILMAILGYTQLARIYIPADNTAAHEKLSRIEKASNRAKGMVAQILAFSRQGNSTKLSVQMGPIVTEALNLLKASLPSNITLIAEFKENVPSVMADPVQIHQVVINLCSNAAHAMESQGGECRISLSPYSLGQDEASALNLPSGLYTLLAVSDTGQGMDRKILDKIFDPYFTTKEVGKGTGMGLAVVHGIIIGCGGRVKVESTLGQGTRFELLFPAAESPVKSPDVHGDSGDVRGGERVLFVDDERDIREFADECLSGLGYRVVTARDGREALDLVEAHPMDYDIVVTDLTMPHVSGEQLAEGIHAIRSDLPVILCTGYNTYLPDQQGGDRAIVDILIKPVPGKDMAEAIRSALDGPAGQPQTAKT